MSNRLRQLFLTVHYPYPSPIDRQRARGLLMILWVMMALWAVGLTSLLVVTTTSQDVLELSPEFWVLGIGVIPVVVFFLFQLVQSGRLGTASVVFVVFSFFIAGNITQRIDNPLTTLLFPPLVATSLLFGRRGTITGIVVIIVLLIAGGFSQAQLTDPIEVIPSDSILQDFGVVVVMYLVVGLYMFIFGADSQRIVDDSLNQVEVFRHVSQFPTEVSTDSTEDQVYVRLLTTLRTITEADFVRLFLVDDTGELYRRVTINLDRLETFQVNSSQFNPVGPLRQSIDTLEQSIVTSQDNSLRRAHLLPSAIFAATIPMVYLDSLVGVIDLQTTHEPLSEGYQHAAQLLAYQSAQAILQIRTQKALKVDLEQKDAALLSLRSRLKEGNVPRFVTGSLGKHLSLHAGGTYGFDFIGESGVVASTEQLPAETMSALRKGEPYIRSVDGVQHISVPIQRADELLGAMSFELPSGSDLTDRQIDLARSIAGRLAVALDNQRLYEQSRMQADRERKASEIANQLISLTDVDAVLTEAAESFNRALGAVGTRVHIQLPSSDDAALLSKQNGGG